jgi:uncharacterized protein YceK
MNYEKKVVSIILALTLVFSIMLSLSGCSSGKSSTAAVAPSSSNQPLIQVSHRLLQANYQIKFL